MSTSAEAPPPRASSLWDDAPINRRLGWVVAVAAVILASTSAVPTLFEFPDFAPAWSVGAFVMLGMFAVLLCTGLILPLTLLRTLWCALTPMSIVLGFLSVPAYRGDDLDAMRPWMWPLDPAVVALLAFVAPAWIALLGATLSATAPLLSTLVFLGEPTPAIATATPLHLSVITLVAILLALRGRLGVLHDSEAEARMATVRSAQAEADTERQRALTRVVHDEVLAVLTAAIQIGGPVPAALQREARSALETLEREETRTGGGGLLATKQAAEYIAAILRESDVRCVVDSDVVDGFVPQEAAETVARAAAEAVRNSIRHSGLPTPPRVRLSMHPREITAVVADDGAGFDLGGIDPERLGVRESILGRMRALEGGDAEIRSAPGRGTEVELTWRP